MFNVGEEVYARWGRTGLFHDCKVLAVSANGSYQVVYSDGDKAYVHGSLFRSKKQGTSKFITVRNVMLPSKVEVK